jgi:glycosyltransferase involved in cell wall biosynthesis
MREYQFGLHLARAHRLTIAFIADNPDSAGPISALRREFGDLEFAEVPRAWKSLSSAVRLATGESCTLSYFRSEALRTRLAERLRRTRYDVVFVSSSSMIQYALEADPSIPMVMDFGSVGSEWWLQEGARGAFPGTRFFRTEAARLRAAEAAAAHRAAILIAETSEAGSIVASLAAGACPIVLPSGIDVEAFPAKRPTGKAPTMIFIVGLKGRAEIDHAAYFCESIVPAVRARVPRARFVLASRDAAGVTARFAGVEVLASGSDLRLLFHDQTVAAAPLRLGLDVRRSVLEPMAAGIPVVTTSGIRDELGAGEGRELVSGDSPGEFAAQAIELLENRARREEIGAGGRSFVRKTFSWEMVGIRLEELLSTAVGTGRSGPTTPPKPRPLPARSGN